jgi:predicted nucleic acid-binding protein
LSVYADSSFVVSLYLNDTNSVEARRRVPEVSSLIFTPLHQAEWAHALAKHQFWGNLSADKATQIHARFVLHQASGLWRDAPLPELAFELCADLGRQYGPSFGLRTLDTLHVACALELKAERFWTFDERQAKLAKAEGMKTA